MPDNAFVEFLQAARKLIRSSQLAPTEFLVASTTLTMELIDTFLEACPTEEMRREIRKGLHAFPDTLTQLIHAWQPGRSEQARQAAYQEMKRKWSSAMGTAQASTVRAATTRP